MRNIKLIIEYDGTNYHGWQSQINAIAIQDVIQEAIKKLTGEKSNLTGSSRTDVGVHALGQVANFFTHSSIPPERFSNALNSVLPNDIVIKGSEEVDMDFHSRYSSKGKKYIYKIYNSNYPSALHRNRVHHVVRKLNISAMKEAAIYLLGEHDFTSFRASGSSVKSSIRTITNVDLIEVGNVIEFAIAGNGFLYNMVRIIAGTLVEIGLGVRPNEEIKQIIDGKDRKRAGKTAPAQGLYLVEVYY